MATATISRRPKKEPDERSRKTGAPLARADRQQNFFAERVFELGKLQFCFALIAQDFEHRGPALLGHFDAATVDAYDMHLQRFDLKIPVIAAVGTGQRHLTLLRLFDSMQWPRPGAMQIWPKSARFVQDGVGILPNSQLGTRSALDCLGQPRWQRQARRWRRAGRREQRRGRSASRALGSAAGDVIRNRGTTRNLTVRSRRRVLP